MDQRTCPPGTDAREHTTDPVCGMTVSPERAAGMLEHQGKQYFFCSAGCLQKFQAEPARYTATPSPHAAASHVTAPPVHEAGDYTCPMHPEVRQTGPGACPQCGMALEPATPAVPVTRTVYTCPMHPEIVRDAPGACPICGMALEPTDRDGRGGGEPRAGGHDPPVLGERRPDRAPGPVSPWPRCSPGARSRTSLPGRLLAWVQLALATPVVLWGGWPFFVRGWASIVNRHLNMFTLIAIGTGTAYGYSVVATLFPDLFPHAFRGHGGGAAVYFEAAAVITTLVLLGQVLELRARSQTSSAIRALLGLAPKTARRRARGRHRGGPPARARPAGRPAPRPPGGEGAGRRRRPRGHERRGRVDGHRRADSGGEGRRRAGSSAARSTAPAASSCGPSGWAARRCSPRSSAW